MSDYGEICTQLCKFKGLDAFNDYKYIILWKLIEVLELCDFFYTLNIYYVSTVYVSKKILEHL